jgi:hypothetical protein
VSLRSAAYLAEHPSVTDVRMCVAGGRCQTRAVRQGSDGPPVRLTVTMYAGRIPVHTSQATLGPLTVNPGGGCHVTGYWVFAELRADGSLGHGQVA